MINGVLDKFPADNLWVEAMNSLDSTEEVSKLRNRDQTELFFYEIDQRVRHGELINININGKVRTSKSVDAQALCLHIKRKLEEVYGVKRPMTNLNILRDQNEYARVVKRRPETFKYECDAIDEWAEMETTGYNASVEEKYLKQFSDMQAARYYHRISCSPTQAIDPNADIQLETVPGGRKGSENLLLLNYVMTAGQLRQVVPIGYIRIDVSEVLSSEWYKEYCRCKEQKWSLINKHNVRARELEYAQVILNVFSRVRNIAKLGFTTTKSFQVFFEEEAAKLGIFFSVLGDKEMYRKLEGMCEAVHTIAQLDSKILQLKAKNAAMSHLQAEKIERDLKLMKETLGQMIKRQEDMVALWKEYQKIG